MKKIIAQLLIRTLIVVGIGVGLYVAHVQVVELKNKQAEDVARLERVPQLELEIANQQADFDKRAFDITRIQDLLIGRNDIPSVVASIEQEGASQGVSVTVPEITEIQQVDAKGKVLPPSGPTQDIGIKVSAQGDPDAIITFVHLIEHLPHLLYVESLTMQYKPPDPEANPAPEGIIPRPVAAAQINLVLTVERNQE